MESKASSCTSLSNTLVHGYIREIQQTLCYQIIPIEITALCLQFYHFTNLIFCVRANPNTLYVGNIHNIDNGPIYQDGIDTVGSMYISGCCATSEFRPQPRSLPSHISRDISHQSTVLFKCGGWSTGSCHAIIVDNNDSSKTCIWNLPPMSTSCVYGCSVAFSPQSQLLLSVGGQTNNGNIVRGLFFDTVDKKLPDWQIITTIPQKRYNASCVVLNKRNALMVLGGKETDVNLKKACLYDIDDDKWRNASDFTVGRRAAGVVCNQWKEQLYLGGGIDDKDEGKSVESYDFAKDKWNVLPSTQFGHKLHPVLWIENNVLLYIASISKARGMAFYKSSNSAEFIDLRICDQWNTVVHDDFMNRVFGVKGNINFDDCKLLAN
eukprot:135329_1